MTLGKLELESCDAGGGQQHCARISQQVDNHHQAGRICAAQHLSTRFIGVLASASYSASHRERSVSTAPANPHACLQVQRPQALLVTSKCDIPKHFGKKPVHRQDGKPNYPKNRADAAIKHQYDNRQRVHDEGAEVRHT